MRKRLIILFLAGVLVAVSGCSQFAADATKTIEAESGTLQAEAAEKKAAEKAEEKAAEATAAEAAEAAADAEGELPVPNADHLNLLPGRWMDAVSQRAGMTICELDEEYQYYVEVFWGGSALEYSVWSMNAVYDPETDSVRYTDGACYLNTYDAETGEIAEQEVLWLDAEGSFHFTEDGHLLWTDSREEQAAGMEFVRTYSLEVPEEVLKEKYFDVVLGLETGTAGASLKEAQAACALLTFAGERDLMNIDQAIFTDTLLAVIETLEEEQVETLRTNLESLAALIDEAAGETDLGESRGMFEDAGVFDQMVECTENTGTMESWKVLHRLTSQLIVDDTEIEEPEEQK